MANSQTPHPKVPGPKTASAEDRERWQEIVQLAEKTVAKDSLIIPSPEATATSAPSFAATVDAAAIGTSDKASRLPDDTPWTGEADPEAVDAESVFKSVKADADVAARSLLPDRPWGNARLRLAFWLVASVMLILGAIAIAGLASVPVGLAAIIAVIRTLRGAYGSRLERRIASTAGGARSRSEEPPVVPRDDRPSSEASGGPAGSA